MTGSESLEESSGLSADSHRRFLWLCSLVVLLALILPMPSNQKIIVMGLPIPDLCVMRASFGVECPGCGLTRSFVSMGHAHWFEAWAYNRVGPLFFLVFAFQIPYRLFALAKPQRALKNRLWDWTVPLVLGLLVVNWLYNLIAAYL